MHPRNHNIQMILRPKTLRTISFCSSTSSETVITSGLCAIRMVCRVPERDIVHDLNGCSEFNLASRMSFYLDNRGRLVFSDRAPYERSLALQLIFQKFFILHRGCLIRRFLVS
jgi:hypothetical protein